MAMLIWSDLQINCGYSTASTSMSLEETTQHNTWEGRVGMRAAELG